MKSPKRCLPSVHYIHFLIHFSKGKGHIGGFTTICSVLREPKIFTGSVIDVTYLNFILNLRFLLERNFQYFGICRLKKKRP